MPVLASGSYRILLPELSEVTSDSTLVTSDSIKKLNLLYLNA